MFVWETRNDHLFLILLLYIYKKYMLCLTLIYVQWQNIMDKMHRSVLVKLSLSAISPNQLHAFEHLAKLIWDKPFCKAVSPKTIVIDR